MSGRRAKRERREARARAEREATVRLMAAYGRACEEIEAAAYMDLIVGPGQSPGFEPAFAHVSVEGSPPDAPPRFRCWPVYAGEAVGPTREVRLA